ncbi:protein SERAC1 [Microdochium nivale]|nr:protein SERAC1 [Microdochium nivale]
MLRRLFKKRRLPSNAATTDDSWQDITADGPAAVVTPEPQTTPHSDISPTTRVASERRGSEPEGEHPKKGPLGCHVLYDPPTQLAPAADVVFVHGLTGDSHDTWCHKSDFEHVDWPSDLLKLDLPDVRVLGFGYDADVVGIWTPASTNRAANHAENLLGSITRLRERTGSEDRPLLFVMHSLGGIVVQNALELSRSSPEPYLRRMEASTRGLCFMGTPNLGSDKALWGSLFVNILNIVKKTNRPIVKVLMPDSEALAVIQKRFHGILRTSQRSGNPIEVTCFYEEIPMIGIGVVSVFA